MIKTRNQFVYWDFPAPQEVRDAIIREFVPEAEHGTDKRYRGELAKLEANPYTNAASDRLNLVDAMKVNGIEVQSVKSAAEFHKQGNGNYWVITLKQRREDYATTVFVSEIGKFLAFDILWWDIPFLSQDKYLMFVREDASGRIDKCKKLAEELGFVCLEENLFSKLVPELNINCFGRTENWTIRDLLFYWED